MDISQFDFGAEPVSSGTSYKNAEEGDHMARLKALIHCGDVVTSFDGKVKPAAPHVCAIFELHEEGDVDDDGNRLTIHKVFALRSAKNAFVTSKLIPKLCTKEELADIKGFDDLIGKSCQIKIKGGKDTDDKGNPKYVYFEEISSLHPKLKAALPELVDDSLGHIRLQDFDLKALDALSSFDVADYVIKSEQFVAGTHPAVPLVAAKREVDPNYAKPKAKGEKGSETTEETKPDVPQENLNTEEEF